MQEPQQPIPLPDNERQTQAEQRCPGSTLVPLHSCALQLNFGGAFGVCVPRPTFARWNLWTCLVQNVSKVWRLCLSGSLEPPGSAGETSPRHNADGGSSITSRNGHRKSNCRREHQQISKAALAGFSSISAPRKPHQNLISF